MRQVGSDDCLVGAGSRATVALAGVGAIGMLELEVTFYTHASILYLSTSTPPRSLLYLLHHHTITACSNQSREEECCQRMAGFTLNEIQHVWYIHQNY